MAVWFEGSNEINCDLARVGERFENPGEVFVQVVERMPGLANVELVSQSDDSVTIRTNEGLMHRTNIDVRREADSVVAEYDERYEAGSKVTTTTHFAERFVPGGTGVTHHLVMSDVDAPGLLGFFYEKFGSSKTGNAFLAAYQAYFEA